MRSTKDQLVEKDVLMPVKHNVFLWNLPDVEEMPSHDGETILLWSPWKYRCGQRTVRMAVVACSQNQAVFARRRIKFQQDGATCHTARATIDLLKDTFSDSLISRFGPVNWPPRSCDLTPLDYFLWGYVKSLVYADKPQTPDYLEDNIRRVIADIRPQML
ncbi:uncharacterized protein TNCV_3640571 [Trichonephila clavipes]|nr:uncharacterized protein TNCV_3640571 [Trichonephila clavipes]